MAKYKCNSPECASKPPFQGPRGLNKCLNCGAADPSQIRSSTKLMVSTLLLLVIAALVWLFFPGPTTPPTPCEPPCEPLPPPPAPCNLIGFTNTSTENCLLFLKPEYSDSCSGSETITYREVGSNTDSEAGWSPLTAGTSIDLKGRKSIHLEFRMDNNVVLDTTITSGCTKLSPTDIDNRRKLIVKAIEDFIRNPISSARYPAHNFTKFIPDGGVVLPDGTTTSGLRWQNDVFVLWPNKPLQVTVELDDDFGTIKRVVLK